LSEDVPDSLSPVATSPKRNEYIKPLLVSTIISPSLEDAAFVCEEIAHLLSVELNSTN
jgi:hypothetical protein